MANTLVKLYVHVVFHVKKTRITMRKADLPRIFEYIGGILRNHDSIALAVGGVENHVHILMTLPKTQALSDLVRTVKAVSSGWIKSIDPDYYAPFAWQDGYGAFSVSATVKDNVVGYINNQEQHHKVKTYEDEYKEFLKAYEIECDEKYIFCD
ncbi:MAG: transposase [Bacteroidales bacterium]|nr:transposase [Bacteroidales bacterium]